METDEFGRARRCRAASAGLAAAAAGSAGSAALVSAATVLPDQKDLVQADSAEAGSVALAALVSAETGSADPATRQGEGLVQGGFDRGGFGRGTAPLPAGGTPGAGPGQPAAQEGTRGGQPVADSQQQVRHLACEYEGRSCGSEQQQARLIVWFRDGGSNRSSAMRRRCQWHRCGCWRPCQRPRNVSCGRRHRHHPGHGGSQDDRGRRQDFARRAQEEGRRRSHRSAKGADKLETAKKGLLELLSPDQEAVLVGLGYID